MAATKRALVETITPADDNDKNRLSVEVHDVLDYDDKVIGASFTVRSKNWHGDDWWINVHPGDVDELVRMLMDAKLVAQNRRKDLGY